MDKIVLELTSDGTNGEFHSNVDINCTSRSRVASYMLVIIEKLAEIDKLALLMAIETYANEEEG
jgi:hypothetical protein